MDPWSIGSSRARCLRSLDPPPRWRVASFTLAAPPRIPEIPQYGETARPEPDAERLSVDGNYFLRWERGRDGVWRIDRFLGGPIHAPADEMQERGT